MTINICQCGAQSGYAHINCPFSLYSDDPGQIEIWNSKKQLIDNTPSMEQLAQWHDEGGCEATDGCWTEADGTCEHGYESWLLVLNMI